MRRRHGGAASPVSVTTRFLGEPDTVSTFSRTAERGGELRRVPDSIVHAKFMGVNTTVCGKVCNTWTKFFDIPFAAVEQERCRHCTAALATEARSSDRR